MTSPARELNTAALPEAFDAPGLGFLNAGQTGVPALAALLRLSRQLGQRLLPWLVPVALIVGWQIASAQGWISTRVLPAPLDVLKAAWTLTASGELWTHVKVSAGRALLGLAIGGGLGLLLGLLTGSVRWAETLLDSTLQMVRNIPALGLMWVILIVAETISAQAGIGYLTMNAREFLQTDIVLVGILLYALLGKLADLFAKGLERYWLRWHPGYQKSA